MDIDNMTEEEAFEVHYKLSRKFGWSGLLMTQRDIRSCWRDSFGDDSELSDDDVEKVMASWEWRHMDEVLVDMALESVSEALFCLTEKEVA